MTFFPPPQVNTEVQKQHQQISRADICKSMVVDFDDWAVEKFPSEHRRHLGASIIGKNCSRQIWYMFRWFKKPNFGGRMLRLFNRGHREEHALHEMLVGIGCKFENDSYNQVKIEHHEKHFGSEIDNVGYLPERYNFPHRCIFEYKTANANEFAALKSKGMQVGKPEHFAQVCIYGLKLDIRYCVYICVCKNTDEVYMEIVVLDHEIGKMFLDKAGMIITAREAPAKISNTATFFSCKWCNFKEICHYNDLPERNCRSCKYSAAAINGKWNCDLHGEIPETFIPIGCGNYEPNV